MTARTASRRRTIRRLLTDRTVSSQRELVELLAAAGHRVTQATVSRDLDALGALKLDGEDPPRYVLAPEGARPGAGELARALAEFALEIAVSGNLVVVRTLPGAAQVVAGAIDGAGLEGVLGTVAGDDTLLVVAAEAEGGGAVARRLEGLAAGRKGAG